MGVAPMNGTDLGALLTEYSLFADCSAEELADLVAHGSTRDFKKGQDMIVQGDAGEHILILLSGNARISMIASNGHEIVLDYVEPGQVLGEIAALEQSRLV